MTDTDRLAALLHGLDVCANDNDETCPSLAARLVAAGVTVAPSDAAARLREALDRLPRLWWCGGWGTLNEKRYHGNADPCEGESCGQVAYVRDVDLRAALATEEADHE